MVQRYLSTSQKTVNVAVAEKQVNMLMEVNDLVEVNAGFFHSI